VPPRLGSRHLAAVGVTEETDAIVVVVSEQTGSIRIASGGELGDPIAYDEFARTLQQRLAAASEPREAAGPEVQA